MNRQVDARGLACPKPVIETKKLLESISEGSITTIVDNEIAKENVTKLAKSMNYDTDVNEIEGNYYINIFKGQLNEKIEPQGILKKDMVFLIGKDTLGDGSQELGKILIKGFIYTLTESKPYPKALLFVNSGVKLTTEGSEVIAYLKQLESQGVEILSCGTCLDYYQIKNKLLVGGVTNMYTIVEKVNGAKNTVTL
ncbi:MAG: sulfurtransferase-like selenium metabolism protein YedF [Bacillota bacterium]